MSRRREASAPCGWPGIAAGVVRNLRAYCPLEGFEGAQPSGLLFGVGLVLFALGVAVLIETGLSMTRRTA